MQGKNFLMLTTGGCAHNIYRQYTLTSARESAEGEKYAACNRLTTISKRRGKVYIIYLQ